MKVFLSWSGWHSRRLAETLRDWLPNVIQAIEPWISSQDIEKGAVWSSNLDDNLASITAGICCVTPDNQESPWLNFEAGALLSKVGMSMVCPYLLGVRPVDLKPPLSKFQATETNKDDTHRLLMTLNKALDGNKLTEIQLRHALDKWWPDLEKKIHEITVDKDSLARPRSERELLEEILLLTRGIHSSSKDIGLPSDREVLALRRFGARYGTDRDFESASWIPSTLQSSFLAWLSHTLEKDDKDQRE